MNLESIKGAAKAFIAATQKDVVSDETIANRSRLCRQCPLRITNRSSGKVSQTLAKLAQENKVPAEIAGYQCSVCGCSLQLLIPAKEPHQDSNKERAKREKGFKHCWMLKL